MTADVKIYFTPPNNVESLITGRVDGLENLSITYTDELKKSFSSELEFFDDGYALLKYWLLDSQNAFANEVRVRIFDNCCATLIMDGVITAATIDWCEPICSIKANIIEREPEADCIKSKVIWEGEDFLEREQVKVRYCVEIKPTGILYVLIVFYTILVLALQIILSLVSTFLFLLTIITFGFVDSTDTINEMFAWLDDIQARLLICNWYHPTALLREYIQNVCDKCGLQFQSSILNDPTSDYYDTLLFSAQVRKGYKPSQTTGRLIRQNLPTETVETLMRDYLIPMFNANYWVKNGVLIFERKDFFDNPTNVWIDAQQLINQGLVVEDKICFSYLDKERPAFADYQYSQDFADFTGNYAKQRFDKIIEWNDPPSPTQKGKHEVMLMSSAARFRNDRIEDDTYTNLAENPNSLLNSIWSGAFSLYQRQLLLGDHVCANYKFLIYRSGQGPEQGLIRSDYQDDYIEGDFYDYRIDEDTGNVVPYYVPEEDRFNYPFTFRQGLARNLYSNFHYIDNPRYGWGKKYSFEFTFNFSCTQYLAFDFTKTVKMFKNGEVVYGKINDLKINFVNRTISVSGEV